MLTIARRFLATALLVTAVLVGPAAYGGYREDLKLTDFEIVQLPQFCWAQMGVPNTNGPAFKPQECGPWTNHYCPGLVALIRAKRLGEPGKAYRMLDTVDTAIQYTESHTKEYPNCSIRGHVEATKAESQKLRIIYDAGRRSKKKP